MSDLVAIDPSIVSPGVAVYRDSILFANAVLKVPAQAVNDGTRAQIAADAIIAWLHKYDLQPHAIAYEWPQIYQEDTPAIANAVISMAAVDAAVTTALMMGAMLRGAGDFQIYSYKPAEVWGQLPKSKKGSYYGNELNTGCPRGLRIKSRLSAIEFARCVDQHDAGDSVGIGLHALNRLGLRRVFSNS